MQPPELPSVATYSPRRTNLSSWKLRANGVVAVSLFCIVTYVLTSTGSLDPLLWRIIGSLPGDTFSLVRGKVDKQSKRAQLELRRDLAIPVHSMAVQTKDNCMQQ